MPAYVIAQARVSDAAAYEEYKKLAGAAVARYGGRYLARGGATHLLEGDWNPPRLVILEFESAQKAKAFYNSPEYQAARQARQGAAAMNMVVVEGI